MQKFLSVVFTGSCCFVVNLRYQSKTLGKYLNVTKSSLFIDLIFIRNLIKKTEELNKGNKQSKQTNNKK